MENSTLLFALFFAAIYVFSSIKWFLYLKKNNRAKSNLEHENQMLYNDLSSLRDSVRNHEKLLQEFKKVATPEQFQKIKTGLKKLGDFEYLSKEAKEVYCDFFV